MNITIFRSLYHTISTASRDGEGDAILHHFIRELMHVTSTELRRLSTASVDSVCIS